MRTVERLGVVVPARRDGKNAAATARALLASAERVSIPVTVIIVDDGDNEGFGDGLPDDQRLLVASTTEHGPGFARSAGVSAFADHVGTSGSSPEKAWVVSLDADVHLGEEFIPAWLAGIEQKTEDILCAPAHFGALTGERELNREVQVASSWMWADTSLYESLVGVVNVGGCNHAVSLAVCLANGSYLQPTTGAGKDRTIVAGDDWDFGLRARLSLFSIGRVDAPVVVTSTRRLVADPVGFLAGRSYERPFEPIRDASSSQAWPPEEPWNAIAARGRARLAAHFLAKPLFAGIAPEGPLDWFLGKTLFAELLRLSENAPQRDSDWNVFRSELIDFLFEEEVFAYCGRISQHLSGGPAR
jgi:GT2 family glycosyltransferase